MNNQRRILLEQIITHRCILLQEQAVSYASLDNTALLDKYNQAQENYYKMYNQQVQFQNQLVNNAETFYNSNLDVTRSFLKWEDYDVVLDSQKDLDYARKQRPNQNYQLGDTWTSNKDNRSVYLPGFDPNGTGQGTYMKRTEFSKMVHALNRGKS